MVSEQAAKSPSQVVNLDTYRPQELKELHTNLTQELQLLMNNLNTMKLALNKYKASKEALTILDSQKDSGMLLLSLMIFAYIATIYQLLLQKKKRLYH